MTWVRLDDNVEPQIEKRKQAGAAVRAQVAARYGLVPGASFQEVRCHYCSYVGRVSWLKRPTQQYGWISSYDMEFDHVLPRARGGRTVAENLVLACRRCNRSKGARSTVGFGGR